MEEGVLKNDSPVPRNGANIDFGYFNHAFTLAPKGERILVKKRLNQEKTPPKNHLILVENFFEVLNEMVPSNLQTLAAVQIPRFGLVSANE